MGAFVTGGTGFIGKRLVRRLLERDPEPVYVLVYQPTAERADQIGFTQMPIGLHI